MSRSEDRVSVPTNGHHPPLRADGAPVPAPAAGPPPRTRSDIPGEAAGTDLRIAFTPAQVAAGFGILAGLILLVLGRRRGRR